MDRDDWIYLASVILASTGAALFHPGAGLICAGAGTAFPFVLAMLRSGPSKKDKP